MEKTGLAEGSREREVQRTKDEKAGGEPAMSFEDMHVYRTQFDEMSSSFLETLSRNERQPPCRKRPGPWWRNWPYHTQEGTTQVQAEADPYIQEQGPQTRPEGVNKQLIYITFNQIST